VILLRFLLQQGASGGKPDAVNGDVCELRFAEDFAEFCLAADIGGFGDDEEDAAASGSIRGRFRRGGEHFDADTHGVIKARTRGAGVDLRDGALDGVGIFGERKKFVDGVVEADDGGFAVLTENGLRNQDATFLDGGKERRDARAGFDEDDERERVGADVEVRNGLQDTVVGEAKVGGGEAGDDLIFGAPDSDRRVDEDDVGFESGLGALRGLLDGDVRARDHGAVGGLGEGGGNGRG